MGDRIILHCDLNNFFASVEMLRNPELRGKAIAVCGDQEKRHGIVLAKSEPAKKFGVKTGMPIWQAKSLCPDIIIVSTNHADYDRYGKIVREIYYRYTDLVEAFGCDECWLDLTNTPVMKTHTPAEFANELREIVKREVGLTISVGVSWNKAYAKIGSDLKKPDATTVIDRQNYRDVIFPLDVTDMLFIGKKTAEALKRINIRTLGELAVADPVALAGHFGVNAYRMVQMARGGDDEQVQSLDHKRTVKSVGNGTTMHRDLVTIDDVETVLYILAEEVGWRLRKKGFAGSTVHLSVRGTDLTWSGAQKSIPKPTNAAKIIQQTAMEIFRQINNIDVVQNTRSGSHPPHPTHDELTHVVQNTRSGSHPPFPPVHSIRISVSGLTTDMCEQMSLFDTPTSKNHDVLSRTFDKIRKKYGTKSIMFATSARDFEMTFEVLDEFF